MAAFLDKEPESRKETAIGLAQKFGFEIENINVSKLAKGAFKFILIESLPNKEV